MNQMTVTMQPQTPSGFFLPFHADELQQLSVYLIQSCADVITKQASKKNLSELEKLNHSDKFILHLIIS